VYRISSLNILTYGNVITMTGYFVEKFSRGVYKNGNNKQCIFLKMTGEVLICFVNCFILMLL